MRTRNVSGKKKKLQRIQIKRFAKNSLSSVSLRSSDIRLFSHTEEEDDPSTFTLRITLYVQPTCRTRNAKFYQFDDPSLEECQQEDERGVEAQGC